MSGILIGFKSKAGIQGSFSILTPNSTPSCYTIQGDFEDEGIQLVTTRNGKHLVIDPASTIPR